MVADEPTLLVTTQESSGLKKLYVLKLNDIHVKIVGLAIENPLSPLGKFADGKHWPRVSSQP